MTLEDFYILKPLQLQNLREYSARPASSGGPGNWSESPARTRDKAHKARNQRGTSTNAMKPSPGNLPFKVCKRTVSWTEKQYRNRKPGEQGGRRHETSGVRSAPAASC